MLYAALAVAFNHWLPTVNYWNAESSNFHMEAAKLDGDAVCAKLLWRLRT